MLESIVLIELGDLNGKKAVPSKVYSMLQY